MTELHDLEVRINRINAALDSRPTEILLIRGQQIVDLAKQYVRVDTGTLQSDIRLEVREESPTKVSVAVRAGGTQTNPKTGKICDYAQAVEYKYPYLMPAFWEVAPMITEDLRRIFNE
jgi:hypothetical protein